MNLLRALRAHQQKAGFIHKSEQGSRSKRIDWTSDEVRRCVDLYFEYLAKDLVGSKFNKEALYRSFAQEIGRTSASVSMKFQNISAILDIAGHEYMEGLSPLRNYQELLANFVAERLNYFDVPLEESVKEKESDEFAENAAFILGAAPNGDRYIEHLPPFMQDFAKRFDPAERDAKNRRLGEAGEEFVLEQEKIRLILQGRDNLAKNVMWISKEEGDNAGYDILSFDGRGEKKFIEVKTTLGGNLTPFYVSRNELAFCKSNVDKYSLIRLHNFRTKRAGFELPGDVEQYVGLSPETYKAQLRSNIGN
jgi:Domain of unknown function (DUF3883)